MSRLLANRAQTEPLVALIAVVLVVIGVGLYAGALEDAQTLAGDRNPAATTLERALVSLTPGTVVRPVKLNKELLAELGPSARSVRVVIVAGTQKWALGKQPPDHGSPANAQRAVAVRVGPDAVRLGRVRVVIWS